MWPTRPVHTVCDWMYSHSITLKLILYVCNLLQIEKIILQIYAFLFVLFSTQFIYM